MGLEVSSEAGRAGLYAVAGGALLKLAELVLRRSGRKHHEHLAEIDASLHTGAALRDELRKENEHLRGRLVHAEAELGKIKENLATIERLLSIEEQARADAEAEVRLLRRAQRTPIPESRRKPDGDL